ncbi:MAG: peptidoglycan-binding domain-containing protein [Planctomycetota bacterium]|nr:peptidoglycan-binding domain-containing protein [Planctomycetota bacterium]
MPSEQVTANRGDSVTSIAEDRGYFWQTVWEHADNTELREKRGDPNIIAAGDVVVIPPKTRKDETRATGARHEFKRKGVPAQLKLRLTRLGSPRADEPFVLVLDGKHITGSTDGDGKIEIDIPPNARQGELRLKNGKEVYPITVGALDPWDTPTGAQQRLNNMGFACGSSGNLTDAKSVAAIRAFQEKYALPITGEADQTTLRTIDEKHV